MKSKVLLSMAVVAIFSIQNIAAQDVSVILRNKEKRQILYSSILNNNVRFFEFMEAVKASGRAQEGLVALNNGNTEVGPDLVYLKNEASENQLVMDQMVFLMKEFVAINPGFQKVIEEKYPGVGYLLKKDKQKL